MYLKGYNDINRTCSNQNTTNPYVTDSMVYMKQASHTFFLVVKGYFTPVSASNHSEIFCTPTCNLGFYSTHNLENHFRHFHK